MKEKKTIDEQLRDMKFKRDPSEVAKLKQKLKQKESVISDYKKRAAKGTLSSGAGKFLLTIMGTGVLGIGGWLFYSQALPKITENRIEKYKTLQTQVVTLAEDKYYKEADQLSEKIQRKLSNSSNNELLEIYNDIRRFDDEKIDPFVDFKRLEQLVDKQEWRQADELAQNLLKSSEGNRNLLDEHMPNEYESLFDYYQSKIKPTIDDLNEETLLVDGKGIYWSNKDNTKKRLILEAPKIISHISLSPDNKHVAFLSTYLNTTKDRHIYVADIDGNKLTESHDWIEYKLDGVIHDYPLFWVDNDILGFQNIVYHTYSENTVKFYVVDIDENNNFYDLREYNPKK